ncbi:MAG TPA: CRTAC1 family protein, partial [Gammaproteobacteria bacterium]|nr:CRTAC1 family protein [Gammaproteobacteria bacterium]
ARKESPRDALFDALKAQPVLLFSEAPLIPMKSHGAPGVVIFDYDGDGDQDIYVTNGPGMPNSLYANQLNESGVLSFVDVAADAGVAAIDLDGTGACFGDIDNDGDEDLYVLGTGMPNRLFENDGAGAFVEISARSATGGGNLNPSSCSMGDVNGDGLLDIVVANTWSSWDDRLEIFDAFGDIEHNQLFVNKGNNVFMDRSEASGIRDLSGFPAELKGAAGITWAIAMVDYDQDGDVDIVMVDDQGEVLDPAHGGFDRGMIHLMQNDGTGVFADVNVQVGLNRVGAWMSLSFGDLDADGNMDIFVTNLGDYMFTLVPRPFPYTLGSFASRWFLGRSDGSFSDPGVGALRATPFGWGGIMADYDNDGDTDIIYQGGLDVGPFVEASNPGVVLRNNGGADFRYDQEALAKSTNHSRRNVQGVAGGDLNNDGFVDVVSVSSFDLPEPLPLVPYNVDYGSVNDASAFFFPSFTPVSATEFVWNGMEPADGSLSVEINSADNGNHWASVRLMGTVGLTSRGRANRDAIGAVVRFTPKGGDTVMRPVLGGASYASQDSLVVNLGLGDAHRGTVDVLWPGGVRNRFYGLRASEQLVLPEIPCSYDADWSSRHRYRHCVARALKELRHAGKLPRGLAKRLMKSAMRAFHEVHKPGGDDDSSDDAGRRGSHQADRHERGKRHPHT